MSSVINVESWICDNAADFVPPVCNKLMHGGQLKVMFVGGPNSRKDFHLEEGEELFIQVKGDMCLPIMERGKRKEVHIKEGQIFLLPGRIPHSPQRTTNSVGVVFERLRSPAERDALRYYIEGTSELLWERWFYCQDLGKDLRPIIEAYQASEASKTGQPAADSFDGEAAAFKPDIEKTVEDPMDLAVWFQKHDQELKHSRNKAVFGPPAYKSTVTAYGSGTQTVQSEAGAEIFFWQIRGSSELFTPTTTHNLSSGDSILMAPDGNNVQLSLKCQENSWLLAVTMPTP